MTAKSPRRAPALPRSRSSWTALAGALALAVALVGSPGLSEAVGTRTFELRSLKDLEGGDLTGVAVASDGTVRAGLNLGTSPITDASTVWSSVALSDGSVIVGTGNEGKVFRASGGQVQLVATTGQMAVSALAVAFNGDVIAGTFPEGKLFRIPRGAANGAEAKVFAKLEGAEHVWGLAYDDRAKALYAATGPDGKLFRIDQAGNPQVYYDSDEAHLVSVALAPDGSVLAGSSGKALLYKLAAPGRASVLYDFDADDVKAIAVRADGAVFAIANSYADGFSAPKSKGDMPSPQSTKKPKPGKGQLMRISSAGVAQPLLSDDKTHFTALALSADGRPYVGTGAEGRVYTVDENLVTQLVADVESRQVGALSLTGKGYVVGSDPAVFHEVRGVGGTDAVWTSKALDAGLRAQFGLLTWVAEGSVELSTRSGNTAEPDSTWSEWSAAAAAPFKVKSPPARYVQIRARWSRDPKAILREVKLHFVTDNARAVVTSVEASADKDAKSEADKGVVASGGPLADPKATLKLKWKVENPDKDELRFHVHYRIAGQDKWHSALKPGEKLTKEQYDWDTTALPEGTYRVKIEATDELANPPDRVERHVIESGTVLVDNTPPAFKALALTGRRLTGEVVDGLGPIARVEVSVAGSDEWRPLFPKDLVFDEAREELDADVGAIVPPGAHIVAVRVYDAAGNGVTRNVTSQ